MRLNKRGDAEQIMWPEIVFIVLTLAFVSIFFVFIRNSLSGAELSEELYAKKIALIIDASYPNTNISFDATEIYDVAVDSRKKKITDNPLIRIDGSSNAVIVSLKESGKSYTYHYFSDYKNISGFCFVPPSGSKTKYSCTIGVFYNE